MKGGIIMALSEERKEYLYEYQKNKLKRIPLDVPKEKYDKIKAAADSSGDSVNGYIKKAIDGYTEISSNFLFTFSLKRDISFDESIRTDLERVLLSNSDYLSGFVREGTSSGEYKLIIRFKTDKHENFQNIIDEFSGVLKKHDVSYSYSQNTFFNQCASTERNTETQYVPQTEPQPVPEGTDLPSYLTPDILAHIDRYKFAHDTAYQIEIGKIIGMDHLSDFAAFLKQQQ